MKEIIELPMNKKPYIHSNISRSSLFSVLTSQEYAGSINATLTRLLLTEDKEKYNIFKLKSFKKCMENMTMQVNTSNEVIDFSSNPYTENKYAYLYRNINAKKSFSIEATIKYVQDSNASSYIKLVLARERKEFKKKNQEMNFVKEWSLKLFSNGRLVLHSNEHDNLYLGEIDSSMPVSLKIERDSSLIIKYSYNHKDWIEVYKKVLDLDESMEAGIYISPKINPFFYDFYTSHIQLCYTSDNMIIAPHFDYYERYFSKTIPARQIPMSMLAISSKKIIDYFIMLLSKKYYINLGVDEFYIPGRNDFGKRHHMHVNFIYGVDIKKRVFKIIGFDTFLKFSEIDFDGFFQGIQRDIGKSTKINLYKYSSKDYPKVFNLEAVIYSLKSYLHGDNSFAISSSEIIIEDCNRPIVYGLNIHTLICNNEKHISRFLRDIRISYQMYEHNLIIKEMLIFMQHIGILSEEDYERNVKRYDAIIRISGMIKNIVLKNRMAPKENVKEKVKKMLLELKEKEAEALEELIDCLKQYSEK